MNFHLNIASEDEYNFPKIEFKKGDLLDSRVEAIVNPANKQPFLGFGSHISDKIRRCCGKNVIQERKQKGTINLGEAVITSGGASHFRHIIHAAVLNVFDMNPLFLLQLKQRTSDEVLRQSVRSSLDLAVKHEIHSLAFSAMGAGVGAMPIQKCAEIMLKEINDFLKETPDSGLEYIEFLFPKEQNVILFRDTFHNLLLNRDVR